jgi:ABC-2 type transport system permease protein
MLQRIFTIAFLYLKTTYSARATLIFSLAMPLLFTFVLGQAMQAGFGGEPPTRWSLAVVDEDGSDWSASLIARLESEPVVEVQAWSHDAALAAVEQGDLGAALIIPAGFGAGIAAGDAVTLDFRQSAEAITEAQVLLEAVNAVAAEMAGSLAAADLAVRVADQVGILAGAEADREAYHARALEAAQTQWEAAPPVTMSAAAVTRLVAEAVIPVGASQSSPGMLVMYALFFTFGGGAALVAERDEGTLRRLLVMPLGRGTLLTGKLAGIFLGALAQMSLMVLAGQFAFGVGWGQEPLALAVMLLAYGFAGTALGLMVAALARTAAQVSAAGTISIMALASLGGAWWPIEIVPGWMQSLSLALPTGWAMRGFHDIITRGLGLAEVALEAGVLAAFGLAFLLVGVWRFRYE